MPQMRMYNSVTIVCGENSGAAETIRAGLEAMRLRVQLYVGVWKRHLVEFFSGQVPCNEYIVVCAGAPGFTETERDDLPLEEIRLALPCMDEEQQFRPFELLITPQTIRDWIHLPGKLVIWSGCGSGRRAFAEAFLDVGCRAYIGFQGEADADAGNLFVLSFFYHLMTFDRDPAFDCTEEEAFERAAHLDSWCRWGTHRARYYTKDKAIIPEAASQFAALAKQAGVVWPPPPLYKAG